MMEFRYKILSESIAYTGRELRSGWVKETTGFSGDAAAGFIGSCSVAKEDLVDMDDLRAGAVIESALMGHIIIEHPGCSLHTAVLRQRLLICILREFLHENGINARRDGDDLFAEGKKLTVSIAAPSAASSLIHTGINIDPGGAPVPAIGLAHFGIEAAALLDKWLFLYGREMQGCEYAESKVRRIP